MPAINKNKERYEELRRMRNSRIVARYKKLERQGSEGGVQRNTHEWILRQLEEEFYLLSARIERIIKEYQEPPLPVPIAQGSLFE